MKLSSINEEMRTKIHDRFVSKIKSIEHSDQCWIWIGGKFNTGYGMFHIDSYPYAAHKISYLIYTGPIINQLFVLHHCDVKECVNPKHLYLGTQQDNMNDKTKRNRHRAVTGDNHWTRLYPEKVLRGDNHPMRLHPEYVSRGTNHGDKLPHGDEHWTRKTPEKIQTGDKHWSKRYPERIPRGDSSGPRKHPEQMKRGEANGNSKLNESIIIEIRKLANEGYSQRAIGRQFNIDKSTVGSIIKREIWKHII